VNVRRRLSVGLVDQAVVALANAANPILAAALLSKRAAGIMLLALAVAYAANGLGRAFVGEVVLAHAPRLDEPDRRALVRDGAATALCLGVFAALLLVALWASGVSASLGDLVWAAPAVPAVLLQDTGRHAALAAAAPARALAIDAGWVAVQASIIVGLALAGAISGGTLLAAWGAGAAVAAAGWLIRDRVNPLRGRPRRWLAETRHLSGWFTATAVVGQGHTLAVAFSVVGILDEAAYALLRLAQVTVLQPLQNLITAMNALLVPRASRLSGTRDAAALQHQTIRAALALGGFGMVLVVVAPLAAPPLLRWLLPEYVAVAALALPIAVQGMIYLAQVPFTAALRGMQRARSLLVQYVFFSAVSLAAFVTGARLGGLVWAAWGLTAGAAVGFVVMVSAYRLALRRLGHAATATPAPAATQDPAQDPAR